MTDMNDREKSFERKYALDQELMFRIEARATKLFGLWIAEKIGLSGDQAKEFAGSVVSANLEEQGFDDMKRYIAPILAEKNISIGEAEIDMKINAFMEDARLQITGEDR